MTFMTEHSQVYEWHSQIHSRTISLGQQTFEAAEYIILLLLCYLKHRPISHFQIALRVVADFDSCYDKTQNAPAAVCVSTFLGNGTSLRSWHVGVWFHTILRFICKQSCGTEPNVVGYDLWGDNMNTKGLEYCIF